VPGVLYVNGSVVVAVMVPMQLSVAVGAFTIVVDGAAAGGAGGADAGGAAAAAGASGGGADAAGADAGGAAAAGADAGGAGAAGADAGGAAAVQPGPDAGGADVCTAFTVTEHCALITGNSGMSATGAVISFTITVWVCVEVLPWPSS
jgi:hypothetical protein